MMQDLQVDIKQLMEFRNNGAPYSQFSAEYDKVCGKYRGLPGGNWGAEPLTLGEIFRRIRPQHVKSTVYTPRELADELLEQVEVKAGSRLLDCSVGTGNLVIPFARRYKNQLELFINDLDETVTDLAALEILRAGGAADVQTSSRDFLDFAGEFDIIIGNPPYSGHKDMTAAAKLRLRHEFGEVYGNKGDLYYAFFQKGHDLLKDNGQLAFIVSRYFLEAESARDLRRYILTHFTIRYIHDYYGRRPFGAGVDPCVIVLQKAKASGSTAFLAVREDVGSFTAQTGDLSPESMKVLTEDELALVHAMESTASFKLGDMGSFSQGIITGLDKVFIKSRGEAEALGIESGLLVPWIKSKAIDGGDIREYLIYPDLPPGEMEGFIQYAEGFRDRLSQRREVKNGVRAFYELTWGRRKADFIKQRIIFPYKAPASKFVLRENVFHSADIYSYFPESPEYLPYLVELLNSPLYDRYIKIKLKKLGRDLYEYYPHTLKGVMIPDRKQYPEADDYLRAISVILARK